MNPISYYSFCILVTTLGSLLTSGCYTQLALNDEDEDELEPITIDSAPLPILIIEPIYLLLQCVIPYQGVHDRLLFHIPNPISHIHPHDQTRVPQSEKLEFSALVCQGQTKMTLGLGSLDHLVVGDKRACSFVECSLVACSMFTPPFVHPSQCSHGCLLSKGRLPSLTRPSFSPSPA